MSTKRKRKDEEEIKIELKICSSCHEHKPIYEFSKNNYSKDGYQYYCIICNSACGLLSYIEGRKIYNLWLKEKYDNKCTYPGCKETENLDFAHFDTKTKRANLADLFKSHNQLLNELVKGRPLCAIHHLKETINQRPELTIHPWSKYRDECKEENLRMKLRLECCDDCGFKVTKENAEFFHWNHIKPDEKTCRPYNKCSLPLSRIEVAKCNLLCCICHRKHTAEQKRKEWRIFFAHTAIGDIDLTATYFDMSVSYCQAIIDEKMKMRDIYERAYGKKWLKEIKKEIRTFTTWEF
jgi:hypothetical protein